MKDKENYDLLKIPDEVIISELRVELGKKESYIIELESELKKLKKEQGKEARKELNIEMRKLERENHFLIARLDVEQRLNFFRNRDKIHKMKRP